MGDRSPQTYQCESLLQASVLHELLKYRLLPWGAVLQEQSDSASMVPPWGH